VNLNEHKLWPQQFKMKKEPPLVVLYSQSKFQLKEVAEEVKMMGKRKNKVELNLLCQANLRNQKRRNLKQTIKELQKA